MLATFRATSKNNWSQNNYDATELPCRNRAGLCEGCMQRNQCISVLEAPQGALGLENKTKRYSKSHVSDLESTHVEMHGITWNLNEKTDRLVLVLNYDALLFMRKGLPSKEVPIKIIYVTASEKSLLLVPCNIQWYVRKWHNEPLKIGKQTLSLNLRGMQESWLVEIILVWVNTWKTGHLWPIVHSFSAQKKNPHDFKIFAPYTML